MMQGINGRGGVGCICLIVDVALGSMSDMGFRFPPVPRCPMFGCFCFYIREIRKTKPRAQSGGSSHDLDTWLINMVMASPLRIGLWDPFQMAFPWHINEGVSNHLPSRMILQAVEVFFKRRLRILFKNMPVTLQCFAWMVGVLGVAMGGCRKGKGVVLDGHYYQSDWL